MEDNMQSVEEQHKALMARIEEKYPEVTDESQLLTALQADQSNEEETVVKDETETVETETPAPAEDNAPAEEVTTKTDTEVTTPAEEEKPTESKFRDIANFRNKKY